MTLADAPQGMRAQVPLERLRFVGSGLQRPECVLTGQSGDVYTCDVRGGVVRIGADGGQRYLGFTPEHPGTLRPNGFAFLPDRTLLAADFERGGVYRLDANGVWTPHITHVDGMRLHGTNFVGLDHRGRTWISVSTRLEPRFGAFKRGVEDGYLILVEASMARIVADGLGFANECRVHPSGEWIYVNETFGRRLSRFRLYPDRLGPRETIVEFGRGTFPDGLTFDAEGGIWITSIVSNRVLRIAPDGEIVLVIEDADPDHVARVELAYERGEMGLEHVRNVESRMLRNVSSLAFGGHDLKTAFLGCLLGDRVVVFDSPIAGHKPPHWDWT